ncbi:amphi-Trp domain-containing protein [Magnetovibrio sp. PR-2]|uniref:amphi-Trp domain-containing protein n=1 Tax=Magnetovibrio sp. PR-2 TaxID=3120356 RepID=UPI002FCE2808
MKHNGRFRHESLQDNKTIQDLLQAITKGVGSGKVTLEDDKGKLVMEPAGMLRLKINAAVEDGQNKLDVRITWQSDDVSTSKKAPSVK